MFGGGAQELEAPAGKLKSGVKAIDVYGSDVYDAAVKQAAMDDMAIKVGMLLPTLDKFKDNNLGVTSEFPFANVDNLKAALKEYKAYQYVVEKKKSPTKHLII